MTAEPTERVELRQSTANLLQGPVLIAVVLLAIVIRQLFTSHPSATVFVVCAVGAALDALLTAYSLRNLGSTLVVTRDDITFRRGSRKRTPQVIRRTPGSVLSFRTARNGPMGSQYTGYVLKLRDNATGEEVVASAFGRRKVQQACEAAGWAFA